MTVYVENVLFENIIIDGLILFLVTKTLREKTNWWGIFVSSLFGAVFALFSVKIDIEGVFAVAIKLLISLCMAYIVDFKFQKLIKKALLLFLYTFLFGGFVFFIFSFLGVSTKNGINLGYASGVPIIGLLVLCVILFLIMFYFLKKLYKKRKIAAFLYDVKLSFRGKTAVLNGFLDTGNTLLDRCGKPILVLSENKLNEFFNHDEMLLIAFKKYNLLKLKNAQTINVSSISGSTQMFAFEADKCLIDGKETNVMIGVYEHKFFKNKGFDAILSPKMLEVKNV